MDFGSLNTFFGKSKNSPWAKEGLIGGFLALLYPMA
jgi:hypothetical protein